MSNWTTNVYQFIDGTDTLSAASINPVVATLASRDQYLFEQINNIAAETMLVSTDQPINSSLSTNSQGTPVYFNTTSGTGILYGALGAFSADTNTGQLSPSQSSYVFGIIKSVYAGAGTGGIYYGDIYIRGLINDPNINYYNVLDTESQANTSVLNPGPLYLSTKAAGKLTIYPSGASIFVGYYLGGSGANNGVGQFILAPNIDSLNQLYFNYHVFLAPDTAGTQHQEVDTTWTVTGSSIANLGWMSVAEANSLLGINPPYTGASATAVISGGIIQSITVNNGGAGYSVAPTITISGDGTGATATAVINNGVVTSINVNNGGSGYNTSTTIVNLGPGAKFYYNLPTDTAIGVALASQVITARQAKDATLLKKALPAHPASYTLLFVNGVLQTQYDVDHTNGSYIIDENGIWWMDNRNGYQPWYNSVIQLFITKLNPNYGSSVVTSLTSSNNGISIEDSNGISSNTGDLLIGLDLNIVPNSAPVGNGTAIESMAFDTVTGNLNINNAPVVNSITVGPGLNYNITGGQATLSLSNFSLSGEVTDIEPEEADFVYKGLTSYLRLKRPQPNQRIGFIGKLKIPSSIPTNTNLTISLLGFTESGSSTGSSTASFVFEYANTNSGTSISSALTSSSLYLLGNSFPTLVQAEVINNSSGNPAFVIPASSFSANSYVNFRIARTYDVAATYANPIGIIGVNWAIE